MCIPTVRQSAVSLPMKGKVVWTGVIIICTPPDMMAKCSIRESDDDVIYPIGSKAKTWSSRTIRFHRDLVLISYEIRVAL